MIRRLREIVLRRIKVHARTLAALACVSCTAATVPVAHAPEPVDAPAMRAASVAVLVHMSIEVRDSDGAVVESGDAYCTGVVLSPHVVATAGHCVQMEGAEVTLSVSRPPQETDVRRDAIAEMPATLLGANYPADVAVLRVDAASFTQSAPLRLGGVPVASHVIAVGHAGLRLYTYSEGYVSALREVDLFESGDTAPFLQSTILVEHGSSGGALLDDDGRIVGICSHTDGTFSFWATADSLGGVIAKYGIKLD